MYNARMSLRLVPREPRPRCRSLALHRDHDAHRLVIQRTAVGAPRAQVQREVPVDAAAATGTGVGDHPLDALAHRGGMLPDVIVRPVLSEYRQGAGNPKAASQSLRSASRP